MRFLITAGPTREYLDPVRFLSNPSTGKMGFAIARAAARRGHKVTLVAGPVALATPKGVERIDVVSALAMSRAVAKAARNALRERGELLCFIATAAVADWRPARCAARKLKKTAMSPVLRLKRNPDILKNLGTRSADASRIVKVGFSAETDHVLREARRKCREKGLAMIVANDVLQPGAGFGGDTNQVAILYRDGRVERLPLMSKTALASRIVRICDSLLVAGNQ